MTEFNIRNEKPEIGDLVYLSGDNGMFIVLDKEEYSDDEVNYLNYEIVRVYPIRGKLQPFKVESDEIKLSQKMGTDSYDVKIALINKEREKKGYREGEYVKIIKERLAESESVDESVIDYESIKTVDGCLDAINDLDFLYNQFSDKEYLQNKEVVIARLESLRS